MDAVALPGSLVASAADVVAPIHRSLPQTLRRPKPATAVKPAGRGLRAPRAAPARHVEVLEHPFERHTDFEAFLLGAFGAVLPVRSQPPAEGSGRPRRP